MQVSLKAASSLSYDGAEKNKYHIIQLCQDNSEKQQVNTI